MTIISPLLSCLRFSFKVFCTLAVVMLALFAASDYFNGRPILGKLLGDPLALLAIFVAVPTAMGVFFYAILRMWSWDIGRSGVTGRNYWGRRSTISWTDVKEVGFMSVEGIPALTISSISSKREIIAYTLGVDLTGVHRSLTQYAGPDHILTQCFQTST